MNSRLETVAELIVRDVCELEYNRVEEPPDILHCTVGELTAIVYQRLEELED